MGAVVMLALWAVALMMAAPPAGERFRGELYENLDGEIDHSFEAPGRISDVQVCVADALTSIGVPSVLQNGPDKVVIASFLAMSGAVIGTVSLRQLDANRIGAEIRIRGKGWDDRMNVRVRTCLSAAA